MLDSKRVSAAAPGPDLATLSGQAACQAMLAAVPGPAWLARADGSLIAGNAAWFEQRGPQGDPSPEWWAALDPVVQPQARGRWQEAVASAAPFVLEVPIPGAHGQFRSFLVQAQVLPDPAAAEPAWFGTCTDVSAYAAVTSQVQRQALQLSASNALFHLALVSDSEAEVAERCLEVAQQLTGSRRGLLGLWLAEGRAEVLAMTGRSANRSGDPGQAHLAVQLPPEWLGELLAGRPVLGAAPEAGWEWVSGCPGPANFLAVPLQHQDRVFGFLAMGDKPAPYGQADQELLAPLTSAFRVAYERLHAQGRIRELNQALEKRALAMAETMGELDGFAHSISHDLRAPLRHIAGFAQILQRDAGEVLGDRSRGHLQSIQESALHMGRLIDELLALALSGRNLNKAQVDLDALLAEVIEGLGHLTEGRRVRWVVAPLGTALVDGDLLRSVFTNLLGNALKFTRERAEAVIEVGLEHQPTEWVLFVKDNGVGFNPRYARTLFGAFQRLHAAKDYEGIGIGLANVRKIIALHGGRTWAEGRPGEGATIFLALPKGPGPH